MSELIDATKRGRRRWWFVACALPGYFSLVGLVVMVVVLRPPPPHPEPPDWWTVVVVAFGIILSLCWLVAPFSALFGIVTLIRDPWRRERAPWELAGLALLVLGSLVAWFMSMVVGSAIT